MIFHKNCDNLLSRSESLWNKIEGFFRRSVLNKVEYICRLGQNSCDLTSGTDRQRCQKCRLTACFKAGMRENFIRKRKNRTKTRRVLENMKRPTVIVSPFTFEQVCFWSYCHMEQIRSNRKHKPLGKFIVRGKRNLGINN